jgi:hypothetical protein
MDRPGAEKQLSAGRPVSFVNRSKNTNLRSAPTEQLNLISIPLASPNTIQLPVT